MKNVFGTLSKKRFKTHPEIFTNHHRMHLQRAAPTPSNTLCRRSGTPLRDDMSAKSIKCLLQTPPWHDFESFLMILSVYWSPVLQHAMNNIYKQIAWQTIDTASPAGLRAASKQ
jgi:hypothetical protein